MFSERARVVMEKWAPGQIEFIPVACQAPPKIAARLNFASAYYFINLLGRTQRLKWLEMPTQKFPTQKFSPRKDSTEIFGLLPHLREWKLRDRAAGEPLIWHDSPWIIGNMRFSKQSSIFVEDALWRETRREFSRSAECAAGRSEWEQMCLDSIYSPKSPNQ